MDTRPIIMSMRLKFEQMDEWEVREALYHPHAQCFPPEVLEEAMESADARMYMIRHMDKMMARLNEQN